jgi:hypothetical protein
MKLQILSLTTTAATVLLLLLSTIVALQRLPSANAVPAPYELTRQQIVDFRRDGVIVVRGMLEGETLENAVKAVDAIQRKRGWAQRLVHKIIPVYRNLSFQTYRKHEALQKVAFESTAPTICAKLMGLDEEFKKQATIKDDTTKNNTRSLRLLKEAIMGFSKGDLGCGWHVDDKTFWPCVDSHEDNPQHKTMSNNSNSNSNIKKKSRRRRQDAGINVWISLSPVNAEEGGGLAVAPGSHNLTGRGRTGKILRRARRAIASGEGRSTCALARLDPACHDYMETTKRVYDLQPGDAIIHDRYLFHKPDNFKESNNNIDDDKNNAIVTKQRISLRYMPSDATFFDNGLGVDGAANHKNLKTGDPLWKAGEYFPQAWPCQLEAEAGASPKQDVNLLGTKFLKNILASMLSKKK